ncbi:MEDS domain-containing protein [Streptomyces sp. ISL-100]|uniref:MEDS domain-containing protein n=1 Tax=Streptomyces sp. ISL-100 TaxID=2819173 RepID=UPI001BE84391|nr:MEDS domain-containing protein [Streptomyces sp. ISL-100]MBT2398010.1 hypothetical protein [Streptomyces sp. ISL-100]
MSTDSGLNGAGFVHHASLYDGDEAFLAMALPFAEEGLDAGEPVLAATTPANSNCSVAPWARGPTASTRRRRPTSAADRWSASRRSCGT